MSNQITGCTNCGTLRELYHRVECTILHLIRNKRTSEQYGTTTSFTREVFDQLIHYRRILLKKIYNQSYPYAPIDIQDILSVVLPLAKKKDCGCSTPVTSSTTTTTTTTDEFDYFEDQFEGQFE